MLVSASSWWVGAVPYAWQTRPPTQLRWFAIGSIEPRIAFYAGLALMTGAWIATGRHVLAASTTTSVRRLQRTALAWAAPMMVAIPLASRDLWAYATQGRLVQRGFDPYAYAPIDMPGLFTDNVSPGWVYSHAPYGPFWLGLSHPIAAAYGEHVVVAVFLLRLPALAGLLLLLWAVPRLADRTGMRADRAVWLVTASPFTIELVLGAGHNDLLMAGLMTAAAVLALRPGPARAAVVPAAAVMALAAGVKSPAFVGLAFVVPLVLSRPRAPSPTGRDRPAGSISTGSIPPDDNPSGTSISDIATVTIGAVLTGLATFAGVSVVTGFGLGWLDQVGSSAQLVNWLSLPTDAAIAADVLTGHLGGASHLDDPMRHWRTVGLLLAAVAVAAFWVRAVLVATGRRLRQRPWSQPPTSQRYRPATVITLLGAALLTLTLLGPAVQLWYLLWTLPFVGGMTAHRRPVIALVAIMTAMVFTVDPHGISVTMKPVVLAIIAVSTVLAWLALRDIEVGTAPAAQISPAADHDSDRAGAGVHADGRGHL